MDQVLINSRSIMTNFNQFKSVFDIFEEQISGNSQFDFSTLIKYPCSRWFKINENQFDYSDQSVTLFDQFSINFSTNYDQFQSVFDN